MYRDQDSGIMMLTCKEIAFILASDKEISILKKTELRMHLLMCKQCSNYNKQLHLLKTGMKKLFSEKTKLESTQVKNLEEEVIKKLIQKNDEKE